MYTPKHFEVTSPETLAAFVDAHAFGTLITAPEGRPFASHVPFLLDSEHAVLHCHLARANPQWQQLAAAPEVLVIFLGPHGYVSPTWYTDPGVPTWNYTAVHVCGAARVVDDPKHTARHVEALAEKFERGSASPWVPDYDPRRLGGIVGIEVRVRSIEGKFKLSQNRSAADRHGVIAKLRASGRERDAELAGLMDAPP
ncbi:MAG TPA: FMN-binding negative transcriptional regulator [Gammaproteobacteria bacterium]